MHEHTKEVIRELLKDGIDARDKTGKTPLMLAAWIGDENLVKRALKQGADVNAEDSSGNTALHFSAHQDNLNIVRLLIEAGADIAAADKTGWSAQTYAEKNGHAEIAAYLKLWNLQMGLVEANFAVIDNAEKPTWIERGFTECREFPIFLNELDEDKTVMLGVPRTIDEFGTDELLNARILDVSTHLGTYGMGGPGFFGILCEARPDPVWLNVALWGAESYVLLDGRVIGCHSDYYPQYHPWTEKSHDELFRVFKNAVITAIDLTVRDCALRFVSADRMKHECVICRFSDKLPPQGNGEPRKPAFEDGKMSDYLLVTYVDTVLQV
jgi:hypothetical protein